MPATFTVVVVGRPVVPPDRSEPLRVRLEQQLSPFADLRRVDEDGSPGGWAALADLLTAADGPAGVVDAAYVGHASPLADTIADARLGTAQLHRGDEALGVLRIAPADRTLAEQAARDLAAEGEPLRVTTLATRLAASGAEVAPVDAGPYVASVAASPAEAGEALDLAERTDEHRLRLAASVRPNDGFYSTFVVRKLARYVTAATLRAGLRPDAITLLSLVVGLAAAASFAVGPWWAMLLGAVLLQVSLVLDCVDGEVARYTLRFSGFGAWLDAVADRVKELAVYAGLAVGAAGAGADPWLLAAAAMAVLATRHHVDFGFAVRQSDAAAADTTAADRSGLARAGAAATRLSDRTNRRAAQLWAKRVVIMPIGERWLLISVVSVLWGPRAVFLALLATGAIAGTYTTVGRVLRSAVGGVPLTGRARRDLAVLVDAAGVVSAARPPWWLGSRYGWLAPAGSRAAEFGSVLVLAAVLGGRAPIVGYAVLAVVALRLYDLVYRLRHLDAVPARWAAVGALGVVGRLAVLGAAAAAGTGVFAAACGALAALVLAISTADGRVAWSRDGGSGPAIVPELRKVS